MSPTDQQDLKAALLSVYYHSLGRQLEMRGAPTVLLPPAVRPIPLQLALDIVRDQAIDAGRQKTKRRPGDPVDCEQEVLWAMLRSAPPPPIPSPSPKLLGRRYTALTSEPLNRRYAAPLRWFAEKLGFDLREYDDTRATYRAESGVFAAALMAYARGQFAGIKPVIVAQGDEQGFDQAVIKHGAFGGESPRDYLLRVAGSKQVQKELARIQDDIGLTLQALVNDFADCLAFLEVLGQQGDDGYRIYPTSSVVVQDSHNLTTKVTVTTLVRATSAEEIRKTLDPQNWQKFSDAFRVVRYVEDTATGFKEVADNPDTGAWGDVDKKGKPCPREMKLREVVQVPSGLSSTVIAEFENILRITLSQGKLGKDDGSADLTYSLYRSCTSRYLWDERPGGILLDQGFIKVRPLGDETWRVTVRKILRFADRTPASWADTPLQFGQSLNYLAPAALSWWLQSDMYNAERFTHGDRAADGTGG